MKRMCAMLSVLLGATLSTGCGGELSTDAEQGPGASSEAAAPGDGSVIAFAGYCDGVTSWDATAVGFENQVLTLVNQKRATGATCGTTPMAKVAALTLDSRLTCAARVHSKDMSTNNFMSHTGSNGSSPFQRMTSAGYTWTAAAENVAAGQSTPASVVDGWMKSEGHCKNIMGANYKHMGLAYSYSASTTYKHYWTQNFGRQ